MDKKTVLSGIQHLSQHACYKKAYHSLLSILQEKTFVDAENQI